MCSNEENHLDDYRQFYQDNLKADDYRKLLIEILEAGGQAYEFTFFTRAAADFVANLDFKNTDLLILGSGPHALDAVPFVKCVDTITFSEFTDNLREELQKWVNGDADTVDFSCFFRTLCSTLGYADPEKGRLEIESMIRRKVKAIIHCDFLADHILPKEYERPYDLVTSTGTLGSATNDLNVFKKSIKKMNPLVKMGGYLVLRGLFGAEPWWHCGEKTFPYLSYCQKDLQEALDEAGFGQMVWKLQEGNENAFYKHKEVFLVSCVKEKEVTSCKI